MPLCKFPGFAAAFLTLQFHALAQPPAPPSTVLPGFDEAGNFQLSFPTIPGRRYTVERSRDLQVWEPHFLSPLEPSPGDESTMVTGEATASSEFFRVSVLPWQFTYIEQSMDWLEDATMVLAPDGRLLIVYQNRELNSLFYCERLTNGTLTEPRLISSTGALEDPDSWDSAGYSNVSLQLAGDGTLFVVCRDDYMAEVICLWKRPGAGPWFHHAITAPLAAPGNFPKLSISPSNTVGVVYGDGTGSYFAWASSGDPTHWSTLTLSGFSPQDTGDTGILFTGADEALLKSGANLRVNVATRQIREAHFNGQLVPSRSTSGSLLALERHDVGATVFRSEDKGENLERHLGGGPPGR